MALDSIITVKTAARAMAHVNGFVNGNGISNGISNGTSSKHHASDSIEDFLQSVFDLTLQEVLTRGKDRNEPVVRFEKPEDFYIFLHFTV